MDASDMFDVMIDIETTGTNPEHAGIIQLAAVKFDFETGSVDNKFFDRCMWLPNNRYWDENTRQWWGQQKPEILHSILSRAEDPRRVIEDFTIWLGGYTPDEPYRIWAKPTTFDVSFMTSYYRQMGMETPWHFRNVIDLNSFLRGRVLSSQIPPVDVEMQGDAHNAIFDVLYQIGVAFKAKELVAA